MEEMPIDEVKPCDVCLRLTDFEMKGVVTSGFERRSSALKIEATALINA